MADGSAPKPYTEEDVDVAARAIWKVSRRSWPTLPETPTGECREDAAAVLDALAEAGRLLPAGCPPLWEQFGVLGRDLYGGSTVLAEHSRETALERIAEEDDPGLQLVSRLISEWRENADDG